MTEPLPTDRHISVLSQLESIDKQVSGSEHKLEAVRGEPRLHNTPEFLGRADFASEAHFRSHFAVAVVVVDSTRPVAQNYPTCQENDCHALPYPWTSIPIEKYWPPVSQT